MADIKSASAYQLFHQIMGLHHCRTHHLLDGLGVYPGQPPLLFALHKQDGQSQKALSEKLGIKPATITVMVKRMAKAGLIERKQDLKDQRISRVYLTPQGEEVRKKVADVVGTIEDECFNNFSQEEKELIRMLLLKVKENLSDVCHT